jgi:hypothetical protein
MCDRRGSLHATTGCGDRERAGAHKPAGMMTVPLPRPAPSVVACPPPVKVIDVFGGKFSIWQSPFTPPAWAATVGGLHVTRAPSCAPVVVVAA